ncbi:glycosyltransferase family 4 protein [Dasania marina]|uniref:glycosyltransferase family 4 protein n=1 Tax=Dasania marina TaxID=471499 RepID=UPI0030D95E17|tara:strand:- start:94140 stop:95246 length:1107 start_codon:yes stop_codon:yes gene_type:complete
MKTSILFMLHCKQNTGYAIASLEKAFMISALLAGYTKKEIHFSFTKVDNPDPQTHEISYDPASKCKLALLIKKHHITTLLAFDLPQPSWIIKEAKIAGVKKVISYWGASMSSINTGIKLLLKRIEWIYRKKHSPDIFVFESEAMRLTATNGRGIPKKKTRVVNLGVDTSIFYPDNNYNYAHQQFSIPSNRKIVFYSGHMEERKGVRVIINAAKHLADEGKIPDLHFLICGNKNNEKKPYQKMTENHLASKHVTFGGYRNDIEKIMRSSHVGVIASTGWDSFTMSSIEMQASGLPLIVSNLQGLSETIRAGYSGELITPGDHIGLAKKITLILEDSDRYAQYSKSAQQRIVQGFTLEHQTHQLSKLIQP